MAERESYKIDKANHIEARRSRIKGYNALLKRVGQAFYILVGSFKYRTEDSVYTNVVLVIDEIEGIEDPCQD